MTQDDIFAAAFARAATQGTFSVDCGSGAEAARMRFRAYHYLGRVKKDPTILEGKRAELRKAFGAVAMLVEGQNLVFQNRADQGGMKALAAVVGEEAQKAMQQEAAEIEEAGQRLLAEFNSLHQEAGK
jgi:hypothetical protein